MRIRWKPSYRYRYPFWWQMSWWQVNVSKVWAAQHVIIPSKNVSLRDLGWERNYHTLRLAQACAAGRWRHVFFWQILERHTFWEETGFNGLVRQLHGFNFGTSTSMLFPCYFHAISIFFILRIGNSSFFSIFSWPFWWIGCWDASLTKNPSLTVFYPWFPVGFPFQSSDICDTIYNL